MPVSLFTALGDPRRLGVYARVLIALYLAFGIAWVALAVDGIDPAGSPLGSDFLTFYAAAKLALQGRAVDAFAVAKIFAAEQEAVPANTKIFLWNYPPTFHLMVTPLASMPYLAALAVFVVGTLLLYLALIRSIVAEPRALLLALACPAAFLNAFHGQNGFLNTAILGFGLLALEHRPVLAGIALGLLAYKPHLGLLLPFLLAAGGYRRAFVAAGVTVALFTAAATAAFGLDYWRAFFANLSLAAQALEEGWLPWPKMPSAFAFASLLGAPARLAYAAQAVTALAVAAATILAWRRDGPLDLKVALGATATMMLSPYVFDYDLVLMAIPIAILGRHAMASPGSQRTPALTAISLAPLFGPVFGHLLHIQVMWLALVGLYLLCWQALAAERVRSPDRSGDRSGASPLIATAEPA